jgi:tartrate-resistant acid phosphatase type 5
MRRWLVCGAVLVMVGGAAAACGESEGDKGSALNTGGNSSGGASSGGVSGSSTSGGTAGLSSNGGSAGIPATGGSGGIAAGGTGGGTGGGTAASVRFVAIGDAGKGNDGQKQVAAAIAAKCAARGCDFVQLLGDNIYDSGVSSVTDAQWQTKFEEPYANVAAPFWVVLGNHDNGGSGTGNETWKGDIQVAYSMTSTKWKLPSRYYVHQAPGVDFFGLDTNAGMFDQTATQKSDVSSWTTQSTASWKIAFGHHPYKSNGPHGNAGAYEGLPFIPLVNGAGVKSLLETTICGKVDVYLSGHDHSRQWLTDTCNGTELIVSGAGASTTDLNNNNATHWQSDQIGFLYVSIQGNTLTGEFYGVDGTMEYSRTITK